MLAAFVAGNALIVCSYIVLAAVANGGTYEPVTLTARGRSVVISGQIVRCAAVAFFVLCGATHIDLTLHAVAGEDLTLADMSSLPHVVIHALQGFSAATAGAGLILSRRQGRTS